MAFTTLLQNKDIVAALVASSSGDSTDYPKERALAWHRPYQEWRSSSLVSGSTYVSIDLGTPQALDQGAVAILNCNVASLTLHHNDAASLNGTGESMSVTLTKDYRDGLYKAYILPTSFTNARRYLGIVAATTTTTDGLSVMKCGGLLAATSRTVWPWNPGFPMDVDVVVPKVDAGEENFASPVVTADPYMEITLTQRGGSLSDEGTFFEILRLAQGTWAVVYMDDGDASHVYSATLASAGSIRRSSPSVFDIRRMVWRTGN